MKEWPSGDRATLALVFTDILASTALTHELGDEGMRIVREDHVTQGKKFLQQFEGRLIKTIGDSLMVAFKSVDKALDFSRRFHSNPGHPRVQIRAGIHVGSMDVKATDVDGHNVNVASRVAHAIEDAEIWLSNEAMSDLNHLKPERFRHLTWTPHPVTPKGLQATTFWSLTDPSHVPSRTSAAIPTDIPPAIPTAIPTDIPPDVPPHSPARQGGDSVPVRTFTANLPAVDTLLIGRDPELAFLEKAWTESANIVQIIAPGGTGKTALMDKWFRRHLNEVTIFGWSFYSQGTKQDRQTSSDPFFAEIIPFFGIKIQEGATVYARAEAIAQRLREEKVLLILDGLEPLQESTGEMRDSPMKALLQELRTRNKGMVLCTTRVQMKDLPIDEQSPACNLENLTPQDGASLLRAKGVEGSQEELEKASRDFHNHALAVTLLGTYLKEFHKGDIRHRADIRGLLTEESDTDGHANRVMAAYEKMFRGKPELEVLRALGYFDRPAEPEALRLLLKKPPERLTLNRLKKLGLLLTSDPAEEIDCHPLVREYFAKVMRQTAAEEFKAGHSLLYEHYSKQAPEKPETREAMLPLFHAVYHGCQAGRHQEACDKIYLDRINHGDGVFYLIRNLGEWGTDLSLLANFFQDPWAKPVEALHPYAQSWVIAQAAFSLRALGRLNDATAPMEAAAKASVQQEDCDNAARNFNNLAALQAALGKLPEAILAARSSIEYADRSKDEFLRCAMRVNLAGVLQQSGGLAEAVRLFEEAEDLQKKDSPEYTFLYSLAGYQYCDLLLDQGKQTEVLCRATATLKIAEEQFGPYAIGLDHLSLGRAHSPGFAESRHHLDRAVHFLRRGGQLDYLPLALLARATPHDLEEAFTIATRSGMRLHLADYHLIQARRLKSIDLKQACEHFHEAERLINETGYHRRDQSLADLRKDLFPNQ